MQRIQKLRLFIGLLGLVLLIAIMSFISSCAVFVTDGPGHGHGYGNGHGNGHGNGRGHEGHH